MHPTLSPARRSLKVGEQGLLFETIDRYDDDMVDALALKGS
jgi:hypothetical protein